MVDDSLVLWTRLFSYYQADSEATSKTITSANEPKVSRINITKSEPPAYNGFESHLHGHMREMAAPTTFRQKIGPISVKKQQLAIPLRWKMAFSKKLYKTTIAPANAPKPVPISRTRIAEPAGR